MTLAPTGRFQPDESLIVLSHGKTYMRTGGCTLGCGACCEAVIIPLDPRLLTSGRFDDWRHWLELHDIRVIIDKDKHYLDAYIPARCRELQENKSCGLWESPERPDLCSRSPRVPEDLETIEDICTYKFSQIGGV